MESRSRFLAYQVFLEFTIIYKPTGFECLKEFFLLWLLWVISSAAAEAIIISLVVIFMTKISMVIVAVSAFPFIFAAAFSLAYRWGSSGSADRKEH